MKNIELSLSAAQCRAARGLLNLSQATVAEASHIAPATLSEFERGERVLSHNNLQAVRTSLEALGVILVPAKGGGVGARLSAVPDGHGSDNATISSDLCRAARYLLNLSQEDLAEAAGVARSTVAEFERGARAPSPANLKALRETLEGSGVVFIEADGSAGPGVRLRD